MTNGEKAGLLVALVGGVALWWMSRPVTVTPNVPAGGTTVTTPNPNAPASTVATQGLGADARRRARYS
jgi:hypothetical protein